VYSVPEELLLHSLAEDFVANLQTHCIGGFGIFTSHIAELILAIGGGFVDNLGNLRR